MSQARGELQVARLGRDACLAQLTLGKRFLPDARGSGKPRPSPYEKIIEEEDQDAAPCLVGEARAVYRAVLD